ncbi:unnamed protein product [Peronospora belbahrii]|uniref:WRKY19-like zinc finger domain-containing protein n=1 Tax=Peronospora belbahrii TaxID=622444 RepID=A0AAU9KMD0_9STRA|nr:unnamed protein product [Peronospora belbahrii]CAH0514441.1 unnamed protein product [Peronospora belbahrii]
MLTGRMDPRPWIMITNVETDDMKHQLMTSCSRVINLSSTASTIATTPFLPSIGSISPANTTMTTQFPVDGSSSLLNPLKLEYCRFQGCANFGKMQGYCHDHIHGRPAPQFSSPTRTPFGQATSPSHMLASSVTQPQYLPALRTVVPTQSRRTEDRQLIPVSPYTNYETSMQPGSPMYTATAVTLGTRYPIYTENATFLSAPLTKRHRVIASPTFSTGMGSTCSYKPPLKCRRDGCTNDARRKGLCMEHGGRHFCKMTGCQKCAHRGGFCISHGGGRRCAVAKCTKSAQSGGICYSHGGGKRCATEGCTHAARSGGFCIKHGKQQQQLQQQEKQCFTELM